MRREMTEIYRKTREFMQGIGTALQMPKNEVQDDLPDGLKVMRSRLNLEETFEKINKGFGVTVFVKDSEGWLHEIVAHGPHTNIAFEITGLYNSVEVLDGCADQSVINAGDLCVAGLTDFRPGNIVADNNLLKLEHGTIREDGKLVKHPDHPKPDLAAEVDRQRQLGSNRFLTDRQRFEFWVMSVELDVTPDEDGNGYLYGMTTLAWRAWQAACT